MAKERRQEEVTVGKAPSKGKFKEVRLAENIISCDERNPVVFGIYESTEDMLTADGEPMPSKLNPDQTVKIVRMRDLDSNEPFAIWHNGGLQGAIKFNKVKKGMAIKIEFKGKVEVDGMPCNNYAITGLEAV